MKELQFTKVKSGNLKAVHHDPKTEVMTVLFHNGTAYAYKPVTKKVYNTILGASSIGKTFNQLVRDTTGTTVERLDNK